jgi:hypothetical protein
MKRHITLALIILLTATLACSFQNGVSPTSQPTDGTPVQIAIPTLIATSTPNPIPVSINTGLASLNSYIMTVNFESTGPGPKESNTVTIVTQRSKDPDAIFTHYTLDLVDDKGNVTNGDNDIYRIGNDQCSGSDQDWTWTSLAPNETEMLNLIPDMMDVTPLIGQPTFVDAETMNDIPSNHFNFKVSGLGVTSGAEVTANQGDYWLAVDGQYIVKYTLVLETRMGPAMDVMHEEIDVELTNVNQPVNIAFTPACLNVKK